MSFAIIISEKGGQERREVFDKNEISIGRVQGNDLLLPKGNVSKRHARIVFRDGRFIVTDLKSTNGSYVNGHRISQATIVREGDKIYIGDFILKVDAGGVSQGASLPPLAQERRGESDMPPGRDFEPPPMMPNASAAPHQPPFRPAHVAYPGQGSSAESRAQMPGAGETNAVGHIPLEHDPDEPLAAGAANVPARGASVRDVGGKRPPAAVAGAIERNIARASVQPVGAATAQAIPRLPSSPAPAPAPAPVAPVAGSVPGPRRREAGAPRASQAALVGALIARIGEYVEESDVEEGDVYPPSDAKRSMVERVLREQARAMQQEGEIPGGLSIEDLVGQAIAEVVGTGPLEDLWRADDVVEISASRYDRITFVRDGAGMMAVDGGFSSEATFRRAITRLARVSGHHVSASDATLDARLPGGGRLTAVFPPVAVGGTILTMRRSRRTETTIDELVRAGAISRGIAALIQHAVLAKANILVVGPGDVAGVTGSVESIVGAIAAAIPSEERTLVLHEGEELATSLPNGATLLMPDRRAAGARVVRAASAIRPARLIMNGVVGEAGAELLEAISAGLEGVIAVAHASSLVHALERISTSIAAFTAGVDLGSARALVSASFDLCIEVARLKAGRQRVRRVAEPTGVEGGAIVLRDLFELTLDPSGGDRDEGSIQSTGVVPAVVLELRARGHRLDESPFRRGAR